MEFIPFLYRNDPEGTAMGRLFSDFAGVDFGANPLDPTFPLVSRQLISGKRGASLRGSVRTTCSRKPGVYGMLDGHGELIYIGKAKSLRARLLSYFRPKSRDPKAGRILRHTTTILWEINPSEF